DDLARDAAIVAGYCKDFVSLEQESLFEAIDRCAQLTRGVNALRLILFCSGPVIGVLVGVWITRNVKGPTHRVSVHLQDSAIGDDRDLDHDGISTPAELPAFQRQVQEVSSMLNQAKGQLEFRLRESDHAQPQVVAGDLAAGIAHELRNPLT